MNAIHPIFAAALAPVTPPSTFAVTIQFADGEYTNTVSAATKERAIVLAVMGARMASPFPCYSGKLLSSEAVPV